MAKEDDAAYWRQLSEVLRRHGFGWVVQQAEEQISEGKPSTKQVSERGYSRAEADSDFVISKPRRRRASLITSEPYTEAEQVEILLNAIEAALVQRAELEQAVFKIPGDIAAIQFQPDTDRLDADDTYLGKSTGWIEMHSNRVSCFLSARGRPLYCLGEENSGNTSGFNRGD